MTDSVNGWKQLDDLGAEYYTEVVKGHGKAPESRSPRQIEISRDIVLRSYPFLENMAKKIKAGLPIRLKSYGREVRLSVSKTNAEVDDIVSEGVLSVISRLGEYRPEFAMSTFLVYAAGWPMHTYASCNSGVFNSMIRTRDKRKREALIDANENYASLSSRVRNGNGPGQRLMDTIPDDEIPDPMESTVTDLLEEKAVRYTNELDERERTVLLGRCGFLNGNTPLLLREVGDMIGVTKAGASVIEQRALNKIRDKLFMPQS